MLGSMGLNFAHSYEWNRRDCFLSRMNTKYWRGTCKTPLKGADHVAYGLKIHLYPTIRHYTILYYIDCVILDIAIVLHKHSIKHELLKTLGFDFVSILNFLEARRTYYYTHGHNKHTLT